MSIEVTAATKQELARTPEDVRLYTLARRAMEDADGDEDAARMLLYEQLTTDMTTLLAIVPEIVNYAFRRQYHGTRAKYHQYSSVPDMDEPSGPRVAPKPEPKSAKMAEIAAANDRIRSWMNYPLPGGKRLGDATFGEVNKAAEFYTAQAAGNALKARILDGIYRRRPSDIAVVGECLTNDEIEEIVRGES